MAVGFFVLVCRPKRTQVFYEYALVLAQAGWADRNIFQAKLGWIEEQWVG